MGSSPTTGTTVGASFISLAPIFMPMAKNQSALILLLLLFQIEAASLGFNLAFGGWGNDGRHIVRGDDFS